MPIKLPFDASQPITGEATASINKPPQEVFGFIADDFFENYPKWSPDVIELEPLNGTNVAIGHKAKQVREDNGNRVESIFQFTDYIASHLLKFEGINAPYRHSYSITENPDTNGTELTFRFELLEMEVFMRPFQKLIRLAIEDGADTTVGSIKELLEC